MELFIFLGGAIAGSIITILINRYGKTYGVIDVDHNLQVCFLNVTSHDLLERSTKKAIFEINHNADLSRKEQSL